MANKASVSEFKNQRNALPGDREKITAVGKYVLELYTDPMGQRPRTVIEINARDELGEYEKVTSVWFNTEDASERQFEDPQTAAKEEFDELRNSVSKVESYL